MCVEGRCSAQAQATWVEREGVNPGLVGGRATLENEVVTYDAEGFTLPKEQQGSSVETCQCSEEHIGAMDDSAHLPTAIVVVG